MSDRPRVIETILAAVAADVEHQVRREVELGYEAGESFAATSEWWTANFNAAVKKARESLWDLL